MHADQQLCGAELLEEEWVVRALRGSQHGWHERRLELLPPQLHGRRARAADVL